MNVILFVKKQVCVSEVFVSMGSCRQRKKNVRAALDTLRRRFGSIHYSSVYLTKAVGFKGDPFFNLVVSFESNDDPVALQQFFKSVERRQGRVHSTKMPGPCPLDLDLLLYGDLIIDIPGLQLPRVDVLQQAFVLEPLAELAPEYVYPGTHKSYRELWNVYRRLHNAGSLARLDWDPLEKQPRVQRWCYPDYTQSIQTV